MIIKLANLKQFVRPLQRHKIMTSGLGLYGGVVGGTLGNVSNMATDRKGVVKRDTKGNILRKPNTDTFKRTMIGAGLGTIGGLSLARGFTGDVDKSAKGWRHFNRQTRNFSRKFHESFDGAFGKYSKYKQGYAQPPKPKTFTHEDLSGFFKTHASKDHTGIKTKKEAIKVYKDAARKHHPDLNPGNKDAESRMKDLTAGWNKVKNSSWFEKLAMLIQSRRLK